MNWIPVALEVAQAVVGDIPALINVINIIKNAISEGRAPTADEWATLDKFADENNASIKAIAEKHGVSL